jgi:hypothetical protein
MFGSARDSQLPKSSDILEVFVDNCVNTPKIEVEGLTILDFLVKIDAAPSKSNYFGL